ncbi:hypothetical protein AB1Y20_005360 [Prymnesium parvum]|uniref:SGNH hydrolase-type esterase domain-containing protein n=1 Tax=Prymnesium parvum TaxID=97485 RepID=A0AB34J3V8_PRYPA
MFMVRGVARDISPVAPPAWPAISQLSTQARLRAVVASSDDAAWLRLASRPFTISVVGCSTSAGCGANDPLRHCSVERSWVRQMHEALLRRGANVTTGVYAKNGVGPGVFRHCTAAYVAADAAVVVVEVMQNLFVELAAPAGGVARELGLLLRALRRAAPEAVPLFAVWLFPKDVSRWRGGRQFRETAAAAAAHGADLIDAPAVLAAAAPNVSVARWYANGGADHHPSPMGHALLGELAAWYIWRRRAAAAAAAAAAAPPPPPPHPPAPPLDERCYHSARELPVVARRGNWTLRDEGGEKRVEKLGLVSTRVADSVALALRLPRATAGLCAADFKARVGYLLSTKPGQGALHISCEGCDCSGLVSRFAQLYNPFPLVQTDGVLQRSEMGDLAHPDPTLANQSISATAATIVNVHLAHRMSADGCRMKLTHVPSARPRAPWSRIRVDSLTLYPISNRTIPCAQNSSTDQKESTAPAWRQRRN